MENYETALKYSAIASDSAGESAKKLAIYQESLEAKQNKATVAFEAFSSTLIDSGLVGAIYDIGAGVFNLGAELPDTVVNILEMVAGMAALSTAFNMLKASSIGTSFSKTFKDLGQPKMTGLHVEMLCLATARKRRDRAADKLSVNRSINKRGLIRAA